MLLLSSFFPSKFAQNIHLLESLHEMWCDHILHFGYPVAEINVENYEHDHEKESEIRQRERERERERERRKKKCTDIHT